MAGSRAAGAMRRMLGAGSFIVGAVPACRGGREGITTRNDGRCGCGCATTGGGDGLLARRGGLGVPFRDPDALRDEREALRGGSGGGTGGERRWGTSGGTTWAGEMLLDDG